MQENSKHYSIFEKIERGGWTSLVIIFIIVDSAMACFGAVRSNSMIVPIVQEKPEAIFKKAEIFRNHQLPDSALIYYSWLAETHRNAKDERTRELVGRSLSEMGQIYYIYYDNYMDAYRCLSEAENILKNIGNRKEYSTVLLNLGNLFNLYEYTFPDPSEKESLGKVFYDRCIEEGTKSGNWNLVCSAYINSVMIDLPFKINCSLNDRMMELLKNTVPDSIADYRLTDCLSRGLDAIARGEYPEAQDVFRNMRDSIGLTAPREIFMADLCLSAVAVHKGDINEAIECVSNILKEPADRNLDDVYMEVYDLLSEYYTRIGDKDKAIEYRVRFFETKDNVIKHIVELEPTRIRLELEQLKSYAHRLDAEKKHTAIMVVALILILLLVGGIAVIIYRKNRELTLKNKVIVNQSLSMMTDRSADRDKAMVQKYRDSSLNDETRRDLIVKIEEVMATIPEICDKGFSLQRLTSIVGSNTSYISRIINEHYKVSFGNLLNKYRIQEACRRMKDTDKYGNLTIDAISESVGFNTRATFTKAFRVNIGMLPSEYLKLVRAKA